MAPKFDPQRFPDRVIFIDTTLSPPVELMNCLECGEMTGRLFNDYELCERCYRKWSLEFCRDWLRVRFGTSRAQSYGATGRDTANVRP